MATYYLEARKIAKEMKQRAEENKRKAERRAEIADNQVEHPLNYLSIEGRSCKIYRNTEQHAALEQGTSLIPWNGKADSLIDRFDARSMLDFYKEPDPSLKDRPKKPEEEKLEQVLRFEAFRDVIRLQAIGLEEAAGLEFVYHENVEIRAAMRAAATAAAAAAAGQRVPQPSIGLSLPAAGQGQYAAVGFNYGGAGGGGGGGGEGTAGYDSSSEDEDNEDEDGEGEGQEGEGGDEDQAQEDEDDRVDDIAELYGVSDYSYRLHRVQQQEGEEEARMRRPPRRRTGRKSARERAKRMRGMGLDPVTGAHVGPARDWTQPLPQQRNTAAAAGGLDIRIARPGRDARDEVLYPRRSHSRSRSRSRSRSGSPKRRRGGESGRAQFITEFTSASGPGRAGQGRAGGSGALAALTAAQQQSAARRPTFDKSMFAAEESILDALPDQPDPAAPGAQSIPLPPTSVQAMRAAATEGRRDPDPHSSSRDRDRDWRGRARDSDRHGYRRRSSRSRSRSRSRDRDRDRRGSQQQQQHQPPRPGSLGGGAGGGGPSGAVSSAAGGAKAGAGASAAKETPQERLKRIMAAQLNKQAQKDNLATAQKKLQAEKEKAARIAQERVVMRRSPSPPPADRRAPYDPYYDRDHERERDRDRNRDRPRSRSRSRSPRSRDRDRPYRRRSRSR